MSNANTHQTETGNVVYFGKMENWMCFYRNKGNINNCNKSLGITKFPV